MKFAILEAGAPPPPLDERFGRYPEMFAKLLGPEYVGRTYQAAMQELPERPQDHFAYIVTGSAAGVYDDLPWIEPLKRFLLEAKGKAKLVGICFGHQIMAETFGGRVTKSPKGWGVGLQEYAVFERLPWMDDAKTVAVPVSHQDQVVEQPPQSVITAGSDFCDIGALAYTDQPAISFQFHPEFQAEYAAALIDLSRDRLNAPDAAIASLQAPNDCERISRWLRGFSQQNCRTFHQ